MTAVELKLNSSQPRLLDPEVGKLKKNMMKLDIAREVYVEVRLGIATRASNDKLGLKIGSRAQIVLR